MAGLTRRERKLFLLLDPSQILWTKFQRLYNKPTPYSFCRYNYIIAIIKLCILLLLHYKYSYYPTYGTDQTKKEQLTRKKRSLIKKKLLQNPFDILLLYNIREKWIQTK